MHEELRLLTEKLSAAVWSAAAARTGRPEHEMAPSALARLLAADENVRVIRSQINKIVLAENRS
jgi:hypothetical protein